MAEAGKAPLVLVREGKIPGPYSDTGGPVAARGKAQSSQKAPRHRTTWSDLRAALTNVEGQRNWFAEGAVEGNPLVLFVAPEKSGKSWALMQLAVAAATGGAWLSRFQIDSPGEAVLIDGEYGQVETARRLARLARGMGHDPNAVLPRIHHVYSAGMQLADKDPTLAGILHDLRAMQPSVVVLDPLRNHLAGSENDSQVVLDALRCCSAIRSAARCPVIIAHHPNKAGGTSGSRALLTRADLVLEGTDEERPWYRARGRTLRQGDAIATPFTVEVRHLDDDDDRVARTVLAARFEGEKAAKGGLSKSAARVLDVLREKNKPTSVGAVRKVTGQNDAVAKRALGELRAAGLADERGGHWAESTAAFFEGLQGPKEGAE